MDTEFRNGSKEGPFQTSFAEEGDLPVDDGSFSEKTGTVVDRHDMHRMGKLQELRRSFRFMSIFGYAVILGATWEFAIATGILALFNGGPAGAIWMFFVVCVGMFFAMLSLAEMASMAPTAGGQYHWVSEFAPKKYQKFLSYLVGWLCVLGWQAGMAGSAFLTALQIEGLIALNMESYVPQGWHGALLTIAITGFSIIFNTVLIRKLPMFEGIVLTIHVFGFFAFLVVLWVMGPRGDPKVVFTEFQDNSGWGNMGLACLVGLVGPIATLLGSDSACHLSEELVDASWVLPRAMFATAIINYVLGWVMTITIMFTLGDVAAALSSPYGQPYIYVLVNATGSRTAASILTATLILMLLFGNVNLVTTASRQLFAFARDNGIPFSKTLAYVRPGWDVPVNAVMFTMGVTCLISLIIIGSSIAFNNIISLSQVGLLSSYMIAIGSIALKRIRKEPLLPSKFDLGRAGLAINIIALGFIAVFFVFGFFPAAPHPDPQTMNWTSMIYSIVVAFALLYYHVRGKYTYVGPVEYVRRLS